MDTEKPTRTEQDTALGSVQERWFTVFRTAVIKASGYDASKVLLAGQITGTTSPREFLVYDLAGITQEPYVHGTGERYAVNVELRFVIHVYGPAAIQSAIQLLNRLQWQGTKDVLFPAGMALKGARLVTSLTEYISRTPYNRTDLEVLVSAQITEGRADSIDKINLNLKV